jgi:hypothetical protein
LVRPFAFRKPKWLDPAFACGFGEASKVAPYDGLTTNRAGSGWAGGSAFR